MDPLKINRLNVLARKAKHDGLTPEEKEEQRILRAEYISMFRSNLKSTLDNVVIVDSQGNRCNLKNKNTAGTDASVHPNEE